MVVNWWIVGVFFVQWYMFYMAIRHTTIPYLDTLLTYAQEKTTCEDNMFVLKEMAYLLSLLQNFQNFNMVGSKDTKCCALYLSQFLVVRTSYPHIFLVLSTLTNR